MSLAHKGKPHLNQRGRAPWNKGKKMDDDFCKKVSEAQIGRVSPRKGVKLSDSTKKKLSDKIGNYRWWNNGIDQRFCEVCPLGYVPGRLNFTRMRLSL